MRSLRGARQSTAEIQGRSEKSNTNRLITAKLLIVYRGTGLLTQRSSYGAGYGLTAPERLRKDFHRELTHSEQSALPS